MTVEFVNGVEHRNDVFDGRLRLDVVDGVEDEAAREERAVLQGTSLRDLLPRRMGEENTVVKGIARP